MPSEPNGRRSARNRKRGGRVPRPLSEQIHRVTRVVDLGNIVKPLTADAGVGLLFTLDDLPAYTELTTLFDRYRIEQVDLTFISQNAPAASTLLFSSLLTSIDLNDAATPASEQILLERENMVHESFTASKNMIKRTVRPRCLDSAGALQMPADTWIDSGIPNIAYYGLKVWVQNYFGTTNNAAIRMYAKYYVALKTAR